jgi:hypothetical protein
MKKLVMFEMNAMSMEYSILKKSNVTSEFLKK